MIAAEERASRPPRVVARVQTGVRIEKRLLKVLKALAELHDLSLGDLLEGIVLHAFEGKPPFGDESRRRIAELRKIYGLDLDASDSHRLVERRPVRTAAGGTSASPARRKGPRGSGKARRRS
jgi:hypothetical protein